MLYCIYKAYIELNKYFQKLFSLSYSMISWNFLLITVPNTWHIASYSNLFRYIHCKSSLDKYAKLAACGVPADGVRVVDCWQWRSGHYFHQSFLFIPVFPPVFFLFFSPSRPFLIEGVLGSKNSFSESCLECQKKLRVDTFPGPIDHFGALNFLNLE